MLPISKEFGHGGTGLYDGTLAKLLAEAQGIKIAVVAGAASGKVNIAAIRQEDTILSALYLAGAGTAVTDVSDVASTTTISSVLAAGTLTLAAVVQNDTAVVHSKTYTFKTKTSLSGATYQVKVGIDDAASAANLAAAINQFDGTVVSAVAVGAVVTVTAKAEGTGPNAYTLVGGAHITAGAATLAGGTTTGGVEFGVSTAGGKVVVFYVNKQ